MVTRVWSLQARLPLFKIHAFSVYVSFLISLCQPLGTFVALSSLVLSCLVSCCWCSFNCFSLLGSILAPTHRPPTAQRRAEESHTHYTILYYTTLRYATHTHFDHHSLRGSLHYTNTLQIHSIPFPFLPFLSLILLSLPLIERSRFHYGTQYSPTIKYCDESTGIESVSIDEWASTWSRIINQSE